MIFLSLNEKLIPQSAEALEIRFDLFDEHPIDVAQFFLNTASLPLLFKTTSHFEELLQLEPSYFDLDIGMDPPFIRMLIAKYLKTSFILSYHNFKETPENLEAIYKSMKRFHPFGVKFATHANTFADAARLFSFGKTLQEPHAIIAMGEKGAWTRILANTVPHRMNYASSGEKPLAPGQWSLETLETLYRYSTINEHTSIYALIGSPITHSQSPLYHNQVFAQQKENAVYIKIPLEINQLEAFFAFAKTIPLKGVSVTMPLKKAVLPFIHHVDEEAKQIGAVNTLRWNQELIFGTNTDGKGAILSMQKKTDLTNQKIVILGTGATAQAIAFEAQKHQAIPILLSRQEIEAKKIPANYDWIINTTPHPMPICADHFIPGTWVMDVAYHPKQTLFLKEAAARGCFILNGQEMFENQAALQSVFWNNDLNCYNTLLL